LNVKPPVSWLSGVAQSMFATIFPSECRICSAFLTNISRLPVCDECIVAMRPMEGTFCARCGETLAQRLASFNQEEADGLCGNCRTAQPPYAVAWAYGSYETGLRELIHLLKYDNVLPAAKVLGRMLTQVILRMQPAFEANEVLVVPVPLHRTKQRQRGFNQSELIVRAALKHSVPGIRFELNPHLLERRRVTESQIGLTQHQRRENLRGAFRVTKPERVAGREILLVDDVFTTGTTISECARVLRRAGAANVWVATVARTLKTSVHGIENFENIPVAMAG
jgi:ComF family protein